MTDLLSSGTAPAARAVESAAALAPRLAASAAATDRDGGFPAEAIGWLGEAGLLAAPLPVAHGGAGLNDAPALGALLRTLAHVGRGDLSVGRLYEGHVNALALVQAFGTPAQLDRAAGDAHAGRLFGVWNTQEPHGGARLRRQEGGGGGAVLLHGAKTFASGAGHVGRALVTAQDEQGGWQLVLVPTDEAPPAVDASFWQPLGMRSTASARADFQTVALPAASLIGAPGDYYRQPGFGAGAIRFCAVQTGGAEAILDETHGFLRALGRADDPYQRMRLGEMATAVETARLWLDGAAARHADLAADAAALVAYVNLARGAVEDACLRVMRLAERSVGARGLLRPAPLERLHRDLTHYLRQPAPDAALADAGRHVLASGRAAHALWTLER